MCLIFFSINQHPRYKLIIAANRDEFYERKTEKASFWKSYSQILGGCDLEAMKPDGTCGTWMAMNKNGRIAMVTNYRDLKNLKQQAPSRGYLVTDFLLSARTPVEYLKKIETTKNNYNGFNLIVGNIGELYYLSNYRDQIEKIKDGLHGLSNSLLNTPWPKVQTGKEKMKILFEESKVDKEKIFEALYDSHQATDDQLPDTGVGIERERMLSSIFIKSPHYGTRCSTIVTVDKEDRVEFTERVYDLQTFQFTQQSFQFSVR